MLIRRLAIVSAAVLVCFLPLTTAVAQSPGTNPPSPSLLTSHSSLATSSDDSSEPFVIEQYATKVRFENDGTGERDLAVRIRVQSDAGVAQLGELVFGYSSDNERMEVNFVRVRQADGKVITAAPESVKDMTAPVARQAPVYTDYKEKHITVPALHPDDTLEYDISTHVEKPLAPGQFWFQHNFLDGVIVLDERLEINVPRARIVKIKTQPGSEPSSRDEGGRRIYSWKNAVLTRPSDEDAAKKKKSAEPKTPAVQFTTFASWEDVARWYAGLERDRITPTPEIRAKAQELTRGRSTSTKRTQALYDYVAKNIRYVSLSFGLSRYQPHAASEVLANQYGDCKDKHTLLASLLAASGVGADAVLIPFSRKLDADVPSPSQFDHVITAIPSAASGAAADDTIWLDTTAEVAPFRLLSPTLRHKSALLVPPDGAGRLVETPADPPFLSTQDVTIEGEVSELGKLTARMRYVMRGDQELALRAAFRATPQAQWKQIGQTIALLDGFRGDVSGVTPTDPTATHDPFEFTLQISEPNFLDWSNKKAKLALPLPGIGMPDAAAESTDDSADEIRLGSPLDVTLRLKLTLPANYTVQPPVAVAVMRDYAEYRSSYKVNGSVFAAERRLRFRMPSVPASRASDYQAFSRALSADEGQTIGVESAVAGTPTIPPTAKADELVEAGAAALQGGNARAAVELFKRVTELDPKRKGAWNSLGLAYFRLNELDPAIAAFRKQIDANPFDESAYDLLGLALLQQRKYDESAAAFKKQIEINPLDKSAHAYLGSLEVERRHYADAVPELEKAVVLSPDDGGLEVTLGQAYLNLEQKDKALAAFDKGVELASSPVVWNNVAYELSQHKLQLDRAQQYAESAVEATAAGLRNVDIEHVTLDNVAAVASLAAYWDTLGWVHFQRSELDQAEPFIRSAWLLSQHGEVGDHLAQIYEKREQKDQAIHTYALALAASRPAPEETRARLAALLGTPAKDSAKAGAKEDARIASLVSKARDELSAMRTISLSSSPKEDATAGFFVLLSPGPKLDAPPTVDAVRFISGSEDLRPFAAQLRSLSFPVAFPGGTPTKLFRRGVLTCLAAAAKCDFVLTPPEDVRTLN